MSIFKKIAVVLGKLTDLLLVGRNAGWWEKGSGIDPRKGK